jgi:ABC-2 type transport system permease protein
VPIWATVLGKFLAAWAFTGVALLLTFPVWITVNYLGQPDNGVIVASYIGSLLMAGGYLAISAALSATTTNQVIAFVVSVVVCFLFTISGAPLVLDVFQAWAPVVLVNTISSFSFLTHFQAITSGVVALRDLIYFGSLIALCLAVNVVLVDLKKSN